MMGRINELGNIAAINVISALSIAAALVRRSMPLRQRAISPFLAVVAPYLHPAAAPGPVLPARQLPRLALVVAADPLYPLRLHGTRLAPVSVCRRGLAVVTVSVGQWFVPILASTVAGSVVLSPH